MQRPGSDSSGCAAASAERRFPPCPEPPAAGPPASSPHVEHNGDTRACLCRLRAEIGPLGARLIAGVTSERPIVPRALIEHLFLLQWNLRKGVVTLA